MRGGFAAQALADDPDSHWYRRASTAPSHALAPDRTRTLGALAIAAAVAVVFIARLVPRNAPSHPRSSIGAELAGLRSLRLWLVLAANVTTSGGVLATYSFIAPILIDRAGISTSLVPLVLTGYGAGSFIGTLIGGRLGDAHPHLVTIITPAVTTIVLLGIGLFSGSAGMAVALVVLLGLFGLSAASVLAHLAVRYAGKAAALGSALCVASFNAGTAIGTAIAGAALATPLGLSGPAMVGTVIVALALIPTIVLALVCRRRETTTDVLVEH